MANNRSKYIISRLPAAMSLWTCYTQMYCTYTAGPTARRQPIWLACVKRQRWQISDKFATSSMCISWSRSAYLSSTYSSPSPIGWVRCCKVVETQLQNVEEVFNQIGSNWIIFPRMQKIKNMVSDHSPAYMYRVLYVLYIHSNHLKSSIPVDAVSSAGALRP